WKEFERVERAVGLRRTLARAVAYVTLAVVLTLSGTMLLAHGVMVMRVLLVVAGVACAYGGVSAVGRAIFGPRFDPMLWISVCWLGLLVLAAIFAPVLPLGEHANTAKTLAVQGFVRPD